MKRVLIISPYFPPTNAADMQRIRMSLPYFKLFGWEAEVVTVQEKYSDMVKDPLLKESLPVGLQVHTVAALPKKVTSKIGLGSIAIRSLLFYRKKVNQLLRDKKYDLIYFSTTQFPVCILGHYWKKMFEIPYVIDIQDPWHTDYYQTKSKHERPPKYWFSYRLNKYLEPLAIKNCDGLICVSQSYIDVLLGRYAALKDKPYSVITFGASAYDFKVVESNKEKVLTAFNKKQSVFNLVYIGVSGTYMKKSLRILFSCFKRGLKESPELFSLFRLHFIGTSYAPAGQGKKSVFPIAEEEGIASVVFEQTDRVSFYSVLASLLEADGLIVPGSDDSGYTASKIYPYILSNKPLLGIFHPESSIVKIIKECNAGEMITLEEDIESAYKKIVSFLENVKVGKTPKTRWEHFEKYTAREMTFKQCDLFNKVLENY